MFVAGHPGSTDRQLTVAELTTLRDRDRCRPPCCAASELRGRYIQFAQDGRRGAAGSCRTRCSASRTASRCSASSSTRCSTTRCWPRSTTRKRTCGSARAAIARSPPRSATRGRESRQAHAEEATRWLPYEYLEGGTGFNSRLARYARTLVRAAAERPKPNGERLREYTDGFLPRLEQQLAAPRADLSRARAPDAVVLARAHARVARPRRAGRAPAARDRDARRSSPRGSSTARSSPTRPCACSLWNGGQAAIDASTDPFIVLARALDAEARELRKWHEDEVEAVVEAAHEDIARARFAVLGTSVYPDATFTLRLNFGTVQGWIENGTPVEPFTQLDRLFERATGQPPFARSRELASGAVRRSTSRRRSTSSTNNDIVGGNSGSPLIDADGRIVGLAIRRQHPLDLGRLLVRRGEEPRGRRAPRDHSRGADEGLPSGAAARRSSARRD